MHPGLSDKADIFKSIERYSVSYHTDFAMRHIFDDTPVILKAGYSKYNMEKNGLTYQLTSFDFQYGFGDSYKFWDRFHFIYYIGGHISFLKDAPGGFNFHSSNSFPFVSAGLYFNIISDLEFKGELQSGLFNSELLGVIPSYEFGLVWRY